MKKILARAFAIVMIIALSVGIGFISSALWDRAERHSYPLKYSEYVDGASEEFGVPRRIIYAVIKCESDFDATAKSGAGAIGLMQIAPATFEEIREKLGDSYETGMMYDPLTNIRYGTYYLSYLYKYFGDWDIVFAAYNAGMGTVSGWLDNSEYTNEEGHLVNIPYKETSDYVVRVNDAIEKYTYLYGEEL